MRGVVATLLVLIVGRRAIGLANARAVELNQGVMDSCLECQHVTTVGRWGIRAQIVL